MRAAAIVLVVLGGCGSMGDDGGGGTVVPAGVYAGTGTFTGLQLVNGANRTFSEAPTITTIVTATGTYLMLSTKFDVVSQLDTGTGMANGTFTAANNTAYGLYPDFNSNNFPLLSANQNGKVSATFKTGADLDATITYSGTSGDILDTTTTFVAASAAPPAAQLPATLAGTFYSSNNSGEPIDVKATATLAITGTAFTGPIECPLMSISPPPQPAPCTVSGTLTPRTDIAAYDVTLSFADGTGRSFTQGWTGTSATGLAYFDGAHLVLGATAGPIAFAFAD